MSWQFCCSALPSDGLQRRWLHGPKGSKTLKIINEKVLTPTFTTEGWNTAHGPMYVVAYRPVNTVFSAFPNIQGSWRQAYLLPLQKCQCRVSMSIYNYIIAWQYNSPLQHAHIAKSIFSLPTSYNKIYRSHQNKLDMRHAYVSPFTPFIASLYKTAITLWHLPAAHS